VGTRFGIRRLPVRVAKIMVSRMGVVRRKYVTAQMRLPERIADTIFAWDREKQ